MRILIVALTLGPAFSLSQPPPPPLPSNSGPLQLEYTVEWRLVEAGKATMAWTPSSARSGAANVHLESVGMVSKLYKLNHDYISQLDDRGCTAITVQKAEEGSRKRETTVTFDGGQKLAQYVEKDLIRNSSDQKEIAISPCTFDVIGALVELRRQPRMDPGQTLLIPVSNGKKFVDARVEVQARETIKTPAGEFKTIRVEPYLFDGALYARKARLHVWFSDDAERIPVQIRVAMRFHIGTITVKLNKKPAG